jgi:hypothetical protein
MGDKAMIEKITADIDKGVRGRLKLGMTDGKTERRTS